MRKCITNVKSFNEVVFIYLSQTKVDQDLLNSVTELGITICMECIKEISKERIPIEKF